jgi:apolipoprotein N-acyltransferase
MTAPLRRLDSWLSARRPIRVRWVALLFGPVATASLLALYSRVEAPWFALGFVALVPWLFALEGAASWKETVGVGAAMSVTFVASVFSWVPGAAERYSHASTPLLWLVLVVAAPLLEPQFVAFALVRHLSLRSPSRRPALRAALAAACAYVGTDLVAPKLFFDTLGQGLYPSVYLRQAADIAGVHGLTLLLLLINEGVFATLRRWPRASAVSAAKGDLPHAEGVGSWRSRAPRVLSPVACALGLFLASYVYGYYRYAAVKASQKAPGYVVGIVQANITNYDKLRAEKGAFDAVRSILDAHYVLSDEIREPSSLDLVVWPETVYPTTFGSPRSEAGAAFDEEINAFVKRRGVPLVFGAYDVEGEREFNAAFFLEASSSGRRSSSTYRKRMLFPLIEWVPEALDADWLRRALPWMGHWERGPGPRVIPLELRDGRSVSIVPLICYDAVFPGFVAEAARMGADLIVTLSNDSWFPDDRAPKLHLISAAFRSIETRLPQVRATNSGISAMIAPTGEIVSMTRWDERETLVASLSGVGRRITPAVAFGQFLGPALLSAALLLSVRAAVRGRGTRKAQARRSRPQIKRRART